ncbi:MAG: hypothetical protein LBM67_07620 [Lentimicrobiaceae bacterium]|nr:hypothetical protein [Lentimicrobiaceae bacterium]
MKESAHITESSNRLLQGIERLIEQTGRQVAVVYRDGEKFATLSRTLSWSHCIELVSIEDSTISYRFAQQAMVLSINITVLLPLRRTM